MPASGSFASGVEHREYPLGSSELGLMYDTCPTERLPDEPTPSEGGLTEPYER